MSALIDTSTVRKFAVGLDHPEGVAVLSTGEVVAGGEAGQLYLIELDGAVTEVGSTGGFMLGLCVDAEDNVFVADTGNGVVWTWSKNGDLVRFCPSNPDERFRQPNALALSAAGLAWTYVFTKETGGIDAAELDDANEARLKEGGVI